MIPTTYKSKLSHLMSYPIGAEKLSKALEDAPQINELSIAFFDSCQDPRRLKNPCPIINIGYYYQRINLTTSNQLIQQGYSGEKWKITVHPVPRSCVKTVKNKLEEEGLEKIKDWLFLYRDATGKDGNCWLDVLYERNTKLLIYQERSKLLG